MLFERGVDDDAEHPVLAANLAPFMADNRHVDLRDALQHLVGADTVESGEPGEQGNDDLQTWGHAGLLSLTRKRRR